MRRFKVIFCAVLTMSFILLAGTGFAYQLKFDGEQDGRMLILITNNRECESSEANYSFPIFPLQSIDRDKLMIPYEIFHGQESVMWTYLWRGESYQGRERRLFSELAYQLNPANGKYLRRFGFSKSDIVMARAIVSRPLFLNNVIIRINAALNEYERMDDIVQTTILCRQKKQLCFSHAAGAPAAAECKIWPVPPMREMFLWQTLMELRAQRANLAKI